MPRAVAPTHAAATTRAATAIDTAALTATLIEGAERLGRALSAAEATRLIDYLHLLERWNSVYNLTAIRDPRQMLTHHLLDCIAIVAPLEQQAPHLPTGVVVDVGSGAGLPGLVLAALWSAARVHLIERTEKKAAFQRQAASALGMPNVTVHQLRIEDWQPAHPPDLIVCRAFASLDDFAHAIDAITGPCTVVAAMKGVLTDDERGALSEPWRVTDVMPLDVPGLDARRHLVWIGRGDAAP